MGRMAKGFTNLWLQESGLSLLLGLLTILILIIHPTSPTGMANRLGVVVYALLLASGVPVAGGIRKLAGMTNAFLALAWVGVESTHFQLSIAGHAHRGGVRRPSGVAVS